MTGDRGTFPAEKGQYRVWFHRDDQPRVLTWSGIPAYPGAEPCWRWGAMKVQVVKWEGPL